MKSIDQIKKECIPSQLEEFDESKRCNIPASDDVCDDWGDSCEGHKCALSKGHKGKHMATDGAHGWVYYSSISHNKKPDPRNYSSRTKYLDDYKVWSEARIEVLEGEVKDLKH